MKNEKFPLFYILCENAENSKIDWFQCEIVNCKLEAEELRDSKKINLRWFIALNSIFAIFHFNSHDLMLFILSNEWKVRRSS